MGSFVKAKGIDYPVAVDVDAETVKGYKVDSFPDHYLIDRSGKLRVADLQMGTSIESFRSFSKKTSLNSNGSEILGAKRGRSRESIAAGAVLGISNTHLGNATLRLEILLRGSIGRTLESFAFPTANRSDG